MLELHGGKTKCAIISPPGDQGRGRIQYMQKNICFGKKPSFGGLLENTGHAIKSRSDRNCHVAAKLL